MNGCPFQRGRSIPEFALDRGACLAGEGNFSDRKCMRPFTGFTSFAMRRECSGKKQKALHIVPFNLFHTSCGVGALMRVRANSQLASRAQCFDNVCLGVRARLFDRGETAGFSIATDLARCHFFPRHGLASFFERSCFFTQLRERWAKGKVSRGRGYKNAARGTRGHPSRHSSLTGRLRSQARRSRRPLALALGRLPGSGRCRRRWKRR